jgi:hypothetical protein
MADLLSNDHIETFYKSHVQSRKNRPQEDIQAIEKEIEKIKQYKAKFLTWCWWNNGQGEQPCAPSSLLGNFSTKCCDLEAHKASTTSSQFKLFNSSEPSSTSSSPLLTTHTFTYTPPTNTQVSYQWIVHDHDYCSHGN